MCSARPKAAVQAAPVENLPCAMKLVHDSADTTGGITETPISAAAHELRRLLASRSVGAEAMARSLALALERWRDAADPVRRETLEQMADSLGFSQELLGQSIEALVKPFTSEALRMLAGRIVNEARLVGFVMAGNVPGAGLHELCLALLSGAAAIVKTSVREQHFFMAFARMLREVDPEAGRRCVVFAWPRSRTDLSAALARQCDLLAAFGADESLARLRENSSGPIAVPEASSGTGALLIGFGSRVSAAALAKGALNGQNCETLAQAVARDVTLFEQRGCLSPHHVFVEGDATMGRRFATEVARALGSLSRSMPPARLALEDAVAVRRWREVVRWRALAGERVALFEGERLGWAVAFDPAGEFTMSPAYRNVTVSTYRCVRELVDRLAAAAERLEAFACAPAPDAELAGALRDLGVSYVCAPGEMQSAPPWWEHGGGAFARLLARSAGCNE